MGSGASKTAVSVKPESNPGNAITCNNGDPTYKSCASAAIISHGKDGHGAYPGGGGAMRIDLGFAATYYNTLMNAYLTSPLVIQGPVAVDFDDIVDYINSRVDAQQSKASNKKKLLDDSAFVAQAIGAR